ncbi:rhodanese-like domain-containing protein [Yinghuangia sp. YIM S09857]|uniref:rhodanese-like domain-containing protein n=1 Tax=Yinghuangia sp. YIM S09857 TaxID=3436929 RepID=UPI003F529B64
MTVLITRPELEIAVKDGSVTVVDTLGGDYWAQQHIPGAVPLRPEEVAEKAAEVLPNRAVAIVTYCSNTACPNSGQVADALTRLGYTNVRKYAEGIQDWVEAGLPTETA